MRNSLFTLLIFLFLFFNCNNNDRNLPHFYEDYDEGIAAAEESSNRILLIFDLWSHPTASTYTLLKDREVQAVIKDYVIIWLKVDDKSMKNNEQTIGEFNLEIQKEMGSVNQPSYIILDEDATQISSPNGYMDKMEFIEFINKYKIGSSQ